MRAAAAASARRWAQRLSAYRTPSHLRSAFELAVTLLPFLGLWAVALAVLDRMPWLSFALALANAGFLVRLFLIQHDCGHGAFLRSRAAPSWFPGT